MPIIIRPAVETDIPDILEVIHSIAAYESLPATSVTATPTTLARTLFSPQSTIRCILAFNSTNPTSPGGLGGLAIYHPSFCTFSGTTGIYIKELFVHESGRGTGLGRALMRHLAGEVEDMGGERLEWSVLLWNGKARRFYEGLGARGMAEGRESEVMFVDGEVLAGLSNRTLGAA